MGIELTPAQTVELDNGYMQPIPGTEKKNRIQLYAVKKSDLKDLEKDQILDIYEDLARFGSYFSQLKLFDRIKEEEDEVESKRKKLEYALWGEQ